MSPPWHPATTDVPRRPSERPWVMVFGVVASLLTALAGFAMFWYVHDDRPGRIDDTVIAKAVADACPAMTRAVADAALPGPVTADTVRAEIRALRRFVGTIRALGFDRLEGDSPALSWLSDWEDLADARDRYADELAAGRRTGFVVPVEHGRPIDQWIAEVPIANQVECRVPAQLTGG